jgi:hypothetical protein
MIVHATGYAFLGWGRVDPRTGPIEYVEKPKEISEALSWYPEPLFQSFWLRFGWMNIYPDQWVYTLALVATVAATIGCSVADSPVPSCRRFAPYACAYWADILFPRPRQRARCVDLPLHLHLGQSLPAGTVSVPCDAGPLPALRRWACRDCHRLGFLLGKLRRSRALSAQSPGTCRRPSTGLLCFPVPCWLALFSLSSPISSPLITRYQSGCASTKSALPIGQKERLPMRSRYLDMISRSRNWCQGVTLR